MRVNINQRGDTLVEVLLATAVLSIVLAGAFSLSTRALRLNQTATERTEVVNKMREQTEMLQLIHTNRTKYINLWKVINDKAIGDEFYFELFVDPATNNFTLQDPNGFNTSVVLAETYVVEYDGTVLAPVDSYGPNGQTDLFNIRVRRETDPSLDYIDFSVLADWEGIGGLGTQSGASVLRLAK